MIEASFSINPRLLSKNFRKRCACQGGRPHSRTKPESKRASDLLTKLARIAWRDEPLPVFPDGEVCIEIDITPDRIHAKGCAKGMAFMDDDACSEAVRDALEGVAYTSDGQCKRTISEKFTRDERAVGIVVRVYRPEDPSHAKDGQ